MAYLTYINKQMVETVAAAETAKNAASLYQPVTGCS